MPEAGVLVVLPTLGERLETLSQALESVAGQRGEVNLTIVLVAPVSATAARELGAEYQAVIVDDPRSGLAAAMNAGLSARTDEEFYLGLGDDDLLRAGGISHLLKRIAHRHGIVVAYGACDYIDEDSVVIGANRSGAMAHRIMRWGPNLVPHPGTLIRIDSLLKVGGFDEKLPYTMDLDAFLKLKSEGRFVSSTRSVAAFRWHADSLTVANRSHSVKEALRVKQAHLPRAIRTVSLIWLIPVSWATNIAGDFVSARAKARSKSPGHQRATGLLDRK